MISFSHYAKTVNNFCITYQGVSPEYVVQLDYIVRYLNFPDFNIELFVPDSFLKFSKIALPISQFPSKEKKFAFRKDIQVEPSGIHPVLNFIYECEISFPKLILKENKGPILICPNATPPVRPLPPINFSGTVVNEPTVEMIEEASWVIGPENEWVFLAASKGIRSTLVPTGIGTDLYRTLFPHGEVF